MSLKSLTSLIKFKKINQVFFFLRFPKFILNTNMTFLLYLCDYQYGTKCVGRIVTKSMSYFLNLCDCSLPYCATLEAWNWFVAGQHLNKSHLRSPVWPNQNVTFFRQLFFEKLQMVITPQRDFDLNPKLRDRPEYQLSSGTIYTAWLASAFLPDRNRP